MDVDGRSFETAVLGWSMRVVVDFRAPWCAPCGTLGSDIEKTPHSFGERAKFAKMNVDEEREIAMGHGTAELGVALRPA